MKKEKKEWRVIFVVYAYLKKTKIKDEDDEMTRHLKDFLGTVLKSNISETNSYCILFNKVNENPPNQEGSFPGIPERKLVFDRTTLYQLEKNRNSKTCFRKIHSFNTKGLVQNPLELTQAFAMINHNKSFHANRTLLVTWGHGSVFGIFKKNKTDSTQTGSSFPGSGFDLLYNEDLAEAILNGLGSKVDIMVMANCYMQNLHAASAFSGVIKIFIAAQGDLEYPCYDFYNLIRKLECSPGISGQELSIFIIRSATAIFSKEKTDKLSLFAIDTSFIDKIEQEISLIANYLISIIDDHKEFRSVLQNIVQYCFPFDTGRRYFSLDLANFLYQIRIFKPSDNEHSYLKEIDNQLSDFIKTISDLANIYIIAKHSGSKFIDYTRYENRGSFCDQLLPNAFSIYTPNKENFRTVPESKYIAYRTGLFEKTTWGQFLNHMNS